MPLRLTSAAFRQGGDIAKTIRAMATTSHHSAPGSRRVRSFLLVCDDTDAPSEIFHHWAAFDIPPDWRGLKESSSVTINGE